MKKLIFVLVTAALVAMFSAPVFAHGGCHGIGRYYSAPVAYSVCAVENCALWGLHEHDGVFYNEHYYGDGHDYHDYCVIEDCFITGYHEHDDVYCFGHVFNDGHTYHSYCGIWNCAITGYHAHDGVYCFGHAFNNSNSYYYGGRGYPQNRGYR